MEIILAVTNDRYELPVCIESSCLAMSKRIGVSHATISRQCRQMNESSGDIKFIKVEVRWTMEELLNELDVMIADVNVNEIADHLSEESLFNWCGAWRQEARRILKEIRDEADNTIRT